MYAAESCESSTCQNQELASSLVKTLAPPICANACSTKGKICCSFPHSYSAWLSQCKFGHFHLILAQQPCLSKIMFFLTLKNASNLAITLEYSFLSSSETLVEASISSASAPIQYRRALICLTSSSAERPESSRNCSNRRFYCGYSSG